MIRKQLFVGQKTFLSTAILLLGLISCGKKQDALLTLTIANPNTGAMIPATARSCRQTMGLVDATTPELAKNYAQFGYLNVIWKGTKNLTPLYLTVTFTSGPFAQTNYTATLAGDELRALFTGATDFDATTGVFSVSSNLSSTGATGLCKLIVGGINVQKTNDPFQVIGMVKMTAVTQDDSGNDTVVTGYGNIKLVNSGF